MPVPPPGFDGEEILIEHCSPTSPPSCSKLSNKNGTPQSGTASTNCSCGYCTLEAPSPHQAAYVQAMSSCCKKTLSRELVLIIAIGLPWKRYSSILSGHRKHFDCLYEDFGKKWCPEEHDIENWRGG
jgi:hypothetical protein